MKGEKPAMLHSLLNSIALSAALHTFLDQMGTKVMNFTELKINH